jgi:hypothetical protein
MHRAMKRFFAKLRRLSVYKVAIHAIIWRAIINGTLFGGASVWYFYFKPNVATYFREMKNR